MQATKSHPYQTRSMTAASQFVGATETHNRGGAASSSGSGAHLAADVHLAVYTTPDKTCLTVADWAGLPEEVCQKILCTDMQTFCKGAQVCKSWWHHTEAPCIGPQSMDFSAEHFWLDDDRADELLEFVLDKVGTCASPSLSSLRIVATSHWDSQDGMEKICHVVTPASFPCLVKLSINFNSFGDWSLLQLLPITLRELYFGLLDSESYETDGSMFGNLCLDLPDLQRCRLSLGADLYNSFQISTCFDLPRLQHMVFEGNGYGDDKPVIFADLDPASLPATCAVVCDWDMSFMCSEMSQHVWTMLEFQDLNQLIKHDNTLDQVTKQNLYHMTM